MNIAQVGKDLCMHVRTCVPLFSIWGSDGPIALILSMVKNTVFKHVARAGKDIDLHVRTCVPLFHICGSAGPIALIFCMLNYTMLTCRL